MRVEIIPCLQDNFSYLVIDDTNNSACVIDPGEAQPIINFLKDKDIELKYILNTHHHFDHIGGNKDLKKKFGATILGFKADINNIPEIDILLEDNQVWKSGNFKAKIIHVPGHTAGHICFYFFEDKFIFTGDTLFSLGCGRIFEGSHMEMYTSLKKIKSLPVETKIYFGHEYTLNNSNFCIVHDPMNQNLKRKIKDIKKKIEKGFNSVPSTIRDELECNIFLRANDLASFSKLRHLKDNF